MNINYRGTANPASVSKLPNWTSTFFPGHPCPSSRLGGRSRSTVDTWSNKCHVHESIYYFKYSCNSSPGKLPFAVQPPHLLQMLQFHLGIGWKRGWNQAPWRHPKAPSYPNLPLNGVRDHRNWDAMGYPIFNQNHIVYAAIWLLTRHLGNFDYWSIPYPCASYIFVFSVSNIFYPTFDTKNPKSTNNYTLCLFNPWKETMFNRYIIIHLHMDHFPELPTMAPRLAWHPWIRPPNPCLPTSAFFTHTKSDWSNIHIVPTASLWALNDNFWGLKLQQLGTASEQNNPFPLILTPPNNKHLRYFLSL